MPWPLIGCGKPTTAASATASWATSALSISAVPVAGDVEHVVDAAGDPVVAVLVALHAVAREVVAGELREVGLLEALVVAPDGAGLARPRRREAERPAHVVA